MGWNTIPLIAGGHTLKAMLQRMPVSLIMMFPQSQCLFFAYILFCLVVIGSLINDKSHTLDDGPNCSHIAFYDFLAKEGQKASKPLFFDFTNFHFILLKLE